MSVSLRHPRPLQSRLWLAPRTVAICLSLCLCTLLPAFAAVSILRGLCSADPVRKLEARATGCMFVARIVLGSPPTLRTSPSERWGLCFTGVCFFCTCTHAFRSDVQKSM